jgi:hypothetical protein
MVAGGRRLCGFSGLLVCEEVLCAVHCVGTSARQPSHFLLLAQEKVTKEKGTPIPAAPAGLLCAARSRREVQKLALRAQTSELLHPSCPALLDASNGDPKSQHQPSARLAAPNLAMIPALPTTATRSEPWCIGSSGPLRRAEQRSGRREKKRSCLSPYSGEFCASRLSRAAQGSPRRGPRNRGRLFFAYFLLAKQKKVSALSGAHPDAVQRNKEHSNNGTKDKRRRQRAIVVKRSSPPDASPSAWAHTEERQRTAAHW